jgi:hypothetical protein
MKSDNIEVKNKNYLSIKGVNIHWHYACILLAMLNPKKRYTWGSGYKGMRYYEIFCEANRSYRENGDVKKLIDYLDVKKDDFLKKILDSVESFSNRAHLYREYLINSKQENRFVEILENMVRSKLIKVIPLKDRKGRNRYELTELGKSIAESIKNFLDSIKN